MAGQRQAQSVPLDFLPGLFTNETDRGAENRWISGDNVRWQDGLAEKIGGYELYDLVSPDDADLLLTYMGKARSTWEWDSLDSETWIALGTACKLYLINRGVLYDITPMRRQATVEDPFTTFVDPDPEADPNFADLVLYATCNGDDASTTFEDSSQYENTIVANAGADITDTNPRFGTGALDCDGSKFISFNYSSPGDPLDIGPGDFTIDFWVRHSNVAGVQQYFDTGHFGTGGGIRCYLNGGTVTVQASFFGGWGDITAVDAFAADNVWHNIRVVRAGNRGYLFIDGVVTPAVSANWTGTNSFSNSESGMHFGASSYASSFGGPIGAMDEIRIYRTALGISNYTPADPPSEGRTTALVHDPGHGAQDGDHVKILGPITVGGATLNGYYTIQTVIDLDNYILEIGAGVTAGEVDTGGTVTFQYDISCGLESDGPLYGYGVGRFGEEAYGTARSTSTYIGKLRVWSLDNWGEDLLASPNGETLYEWRRIWGPDSRARAVVGAPSNIERMIVGPDDRHVIALGTNLATGNHQHDKMFVRWCKGDDYNTWLSASTNDAGSKRLDAGSRLITAVKTNRGILVFADRALYFVSLLGGTDVYSIVPAGLTVEIISPEAAIDVDGIVYFMAHGDFYMWNGVLSLMECDIKTLVFGVPGRPGINKLHSSKVHVRVVKEANEIWWSYPSTSATENDSTAIYNYQLKCWYFSSIPRECGRQSSPSLDRQPYAFYNNRMWLHETGADGDNGTGFVEPLHAFIHSCQRQVMDGALEVRVSKLIPDFDELDGPIDVYVEGRERPQAPIKSRGPFLVFEDTERVCPDLRTRQVAIHIDSNDLGAQWRMGTWSAYATPVGRKSA